MNEDENVEAMIREADKLVVVLKEVEILDPNTFGQDDTDSTLPDTVEHWINYG